MEMEEEKITQLQEMTGLRADEARGCLEDSDWDINSALTSFFHRKTTEACSRPAREPQPQPRIQRGNPRLVTMADIRNSQGQGHENRQAFYVGGSERSGQQVIGPESNRNRDLLAAMLEPGQSEDSEDEEGGVAGGRERREVVLRLWSEGFTVDDGRLREYSDPANSQFLEKIRGGFIPEELVTEARGGTVHCRMEDHRSERYVPSKQKLKAFSGVGHMLGSPTPLVTTDPGATAEPKKEKEEEEEVAPREPPFQLDPSGPTTSVQIRLADGTRLQATLNHGHTVADLRRFIVHERPQYASVPFNLLNSYPSKLLTDDSLTLESAGILNASLLQRLV